MCVEAGTVHFADFVWKLPQVARCAPRPRRTCRQDSWCEESQWDSRLLVQGQKRLNTLLPFHNACPPVIPHPSRLSDLSVVVVRNHLFPHGSLRCLFYFLWTHSPPRGEEFQQVVLTRKPPSTMTILVVWRRLLTVSLLCVVMPSTYPCKWYDSLSVGVVGVSMAEAGARILLLPHEALWPRCCMKSSSVQFWHSVGVSACFHAAWDSNTFGLNS